MRSGDAHVVMMPGIGGYHVTEPAHGYLHPEKIDWIYTTE